MSIFCPVVKRLLPVICPVSVRLLSGSEFGSAPVVWLIYIIGKTHYLKDFVLT